MRFTPRRLPTPVCVHCRRGSSSLTTVVMSQRVYSDFSVAAWPVLWVKVVRPRRHLSRGISRRSPCHNPVAPAISALPQPLPLSIFLPLPLALPLPVFFPHSLMSYPAEVCCFVAPVTYPLDVIRRRMQTETFILNQLQGKGWMVPAAPTKALEPGAVVVVENSGNSLSGVWKHVFQREGPRGLFKASPAMCGPLHTTASSLHGGLMLFCGCWSLCEQGITLNWIKGPISVGISLTLFDLLKGILDN